MRINQGNHKDYPYEVGAETIRACRLTATDKCPGDDDRGGSLDSILSLHNPSRTE